MAEGLGSLELRVEIDAAAKIRNRTLPREPKKWSKPPMPDVQVAAVAFCQTPNLHPQPYTGVSKNRGSKYNTPNSRILITRTPK